MSEDEILGHGANGTVVFNAYFQNRNVAIKRILSIYLHLAQTELNILLKLDHQNIIKYYYFE